MSKLDARKLDHKTREAIRIRAVEPRFDSAYIHDGEKSCQYGRLHDRPNLAMYRGI